MLRRLIVTATVFAVALLLVTLQNKVLVGTQELQAELRSLADDPAKPGLKAYEVVFKDISGNPVPDPPEHFREKVVERLRGRDKADEVQVEEVRFGGGRVLVLAKAEVAEASLRSPIVGRPYERDNPPRSLLHLTRGIDIRGGVEFICRLHDDQGNWVQADEETVHILRNRLDERGLTEPSVAKLSNGDIQVVIPGGTTADAARTRKVLETTGRLEFREILPVGEGRDEKGRDKGVIEVRNLGAPGAKVIARPGGGYVAAPGLYMNRGDIIAPKETEPGATPHLFFRLGPVALQGSDVARADETIEQGQRAVAIEFTAVGASKNGAFTHMVKAKGDRQEGTGRLAVVFDGVVKSDPEVISPSNANCVISGRFTSEEIKSLKDALRGGSLQVIPEVISERVVGATLGEETVSKGLFAVLMSFSVVVIFMFWYYRGLGLVANLSLALCGGMIWAVLSMFSATLTLPGLAGLALTIGMAVDTNILIFERIREELRENKGLRAAIEAGYDRAFLTIIDSNLTTLVTCLVLYVFGSGPVKGFGVSLMIGIVVNLFTGVYVSRLITDWWCRKRETVTMASFIPELRLPYIEWRWYGYALSLITGLVGLLYFSFGHRLTGSSFESRFDIDFTGGNMAQVIFMRPMSGNEIDQAIAKAYAALPEAEKRDSPLAPEELRKQPYFPEFGAGLSDSSRQWVFRARDEEGSRLEAERAKLVEERGRVLARYNVKRSEEKPNAAELKALEGEAQQLKERLDAKTREVAGRSEAFKRTIAAAFPGGIAAEGEEISALAWEGATLRLRLATLDPPTLVQTSDLGARLTKRPELALVRAAPAEGGLEITATYHERPSGTSDFEPTDAAAARILGLCQGQGVAPEQARALAARAYELYNAAMDTAAGLRVTVARPFPATEHFSGQVAERMKWGALIAVLLSLVAILAYVAARFEFRFGAGAVVSLFHDVILTLGVISLLHIRIDLTVIAAILTLIGFSINDTIVTFDRIRENLKRMPGQALTGIIDLSVAQTFPRTVLTTLTVLLTLAVLAIWGGEALRPFSVTLLIGCFFGTYSSVFIAAPLLLTFKGRVVETEAPADPNATPTAPSA